MPDAPAVDIEQGLTQRPHATACQTRAPPASPTWPAHSLCLPSEQGKSRCATHPSNHPCYNQIHSHKPKSPKSNANPPSTSKNPAPKSPSIRQQMRQHTPLESPRCRQKQGELASNASTSRAPSMEDDTEQPNRWGGGDAQRWCVVERRGRRDSRREEHLSPSLGTRFENINSAKKIWSAGH